MLIVIGWKKTECGESYRYFGHLLVGSHFGYGFYTILPPLHGKRAQEIHSTKRRNPQTK